MGGEGTVGTRRAAAPATAIRRIAVFIQNRARFGTLVCHVPLIASLRRHYPAAHLTVVAPFAEASMLIGDQLADELRRWPDGIWAQIRLMRALAADLLITLRPASTFITMLVGLSGARTRLGFDTPMGRPLLSGVRRRDLTIYRPLNYLRLVESLGVEPILAETFVALADRVPQAIDPGNVNVCLMPGGASPFKLWGIDNFLALAARIRADRPDARFVFVLGPDERPLVDAIEASPLAAVSTMLNSPSLGAIAQAVLASRVTIANDCGPSHIAQLLGGAYVGVFANHRGQAERIAGQWFFTRPGARWVSGPAGAPITALSPDEVYRCVEAVWPAALADPAHSIGSR